jgi:hypothetical protein
MQKELEMKLIIIVLGAAAAAFAQTAESGMPVTDAEKIADALRAGPVFVTKDATLLDWPRRPEANIAFFVRARINGPVSRAILDFHTMSRRRSTASSSAGFKAAAPGVRRTSIASASRICMPALG